jgi:hypothetical protein
MKYLKTFESKSKDTVSISDLSEVFTPLMDDGVKVYINQFPTLKGERNGPREKGDFLTTSDSTRENKFTELIKKKEYWLEISGNITQNDIDADENDPTHSYHITKRKEISNFIRNYNYKKLIKKLDDIGIEVYGLERGETKWVTSGNYGPNAQTTNIDKVTLARVK